MVEYLADRHIPRALNAPQRAAPHFRRALPTSGACRNAPVIATGADSLSADELAGALIVLTEAKDTGKREAWAKRGPRSFRAGRGELHRQLCVTLTALRRNWAARNRRQAARARHDMRTWRVEHRQRTRHLIELGGLVIKAGIVDLTGDDRAIIYGALLWMSDRLRSDQGEHARELWAAKGKRAFKTDPATHKGTD